MTDIKLHYFGATWCPPCKTTKPELKIWEGINPKVSVDRHDVDDSPDLARQYEVMSVPTFVVECDGQAIGSWVGGSNSRRIAEEVEALVADCQ